MKLYFDACCVNRLTDDQSQQRIAREAEAIEELIGFATSEPNVWVGSTVLQAEISKNPYTERRADAEMLLTFIKEVVKLAQVRHNHSLAVVAQKRLLTFSTAYRAATARERS